ncbi:hypothetical protein J1N35_004949 [Gossypium stocksii]|uniref:Uncharacterized protein n=1 Tax=Gossypium stocksii TaxID=47602 RepID=A0A9D4AI59_9ROSI|nr:hypothetical protein J1N35_004949 [Gossypium stocksii]
MNYLARLRFKEKEVSWTFYAHKVDFDTLYEVDMDQLGFDVRFPSIAAWDDFTSKWKNSKDFYLDEGPSEPIVVSTNNHDNTTTTPAENIEVTKREDEITRDIEGGEDVP